TRFEAEWLTCVDPKPMLEFLGDHGSNRKLRLFAVACCRRIWPILRDERSRSAVELAEQSADQRISYRALDAASGEAEAAYEDAIPLTDTEDTPEAQIAMAAASAASYASNPDLRNDSNLHIVMDGATDAAPAGAQSERVAQAGLLRDILPVTFGA